MADDDAVAGGGPGRRRRVTAADGPVRKTGDTPMKKAVAAARKTGASKVGPIVAPPAKAVARKAPVAKAPASKAPASKATSTAAPAGARPAKATRKAGATDAVRKAPARKAITRRTGPAQASEPAADTSAPPRFGGSRLAAEQTFADDPAPSPAPRADDPSTRVRALLRSAAAGIREQEAAAGSRSVYDTGYPSAPAPVRPAWPAAKVAPAPPTDSGPAPSVDVEPDPPLGTAAPFQLPPPLEPGPDEVVAPVVEPDAEVLIAPRRRSLRLAPPEPAPEPEWSAGDQPVDEEPVVVDRIPDALDVLSVPGADPPGPRTAVRRFPPPSPPATMSPPTSPPDQAAPATTVMEPPPWTPPPPKADKPRRGRAGGSGRSRSGKVVGILAAVVVLVVLVVGAVAVLAARNSGPEYSKLKVGDCFDSAKSNQVRGIKTKSCAQSHDSEVFFLVTHPGGVKDAYPGKDALVQFAADACLGQPLTDYIGTPLEQSKYKDFEIVPQESAWKDGRRLLVCGIDTGGQGPVKGSAKVAKPAS